VIETASETGPFLYPVSTSHIHFHFGSGHSTPHCMELLFHLGFMMCGWLNARTLGDIEMSIGTIILIILVIALLGGFSGIGGGPFYGTGYYGGGGLGLIIVVLVILLLLGRI
jgi:hypothetical protein